MISTKHLSLKKDTSRRRKEDYRKIQRQIMNDWIFIVEAMKSGDPQALNIIQQKKELENEIQLCKEQLAELPKGFDQRRDVLKSKIDLFTKLEKALLYEYRPDSKRAMLYLKDLYKQKTGIGSCNRKTENSNK